MAATKEKGKTRLDFSGAMSEMLSQSRQVPAKEEERPKAVEEKREVLSEPLEMAEPEVMEEVAEPIAPIEPVKKEKAVSAIKEKSSKAELSLEKRLLLSKKSRGVQKSVYLDADIYEYIEKLSEKYHLKFSAVLNELLRDMIR